MFKFNLKKTSLVLLNAFAILSLSGCDSLIDLSDDDDDGTGYYRFVNLSAQGTVIEVDVDDSAFANLDFSEASALTSVETETYDLTFNQILPNTENNSFIDDDSLSVTSNKIHSYILYGESDSPLALEVITDIYTLFDEDFADDYDYGLLQFVNVADQSGDYDIYVVDAGDDLLNATADSTLAYLEQSADLELDPGYYKIIITESGTDNILVESDNITITTGEAYLYSIVSYKVATSDTERMAVVEIDADSSRMLTNDAQPASLRFNHGISDNYLVDIYVDEGDERTSLVTDLAFGDISEEISLSIDEDGESKDFYIVDSETEETIDSFTLDLGPDSQLDILTAGLESTTIRVNDAEEDLRTIDSHAKIIFSHAIDDENDDSLEFLIVEDGANPDSYTAQVTLTYLTSEEYEIEQGDYVIYVYNADTDELLLEKNLYGLSAGDVVNLTATESEYGGSPYELHNVFN